MDNPRSTSGNHGIVIPDVQSERFYDEASGHQGAIPRNHWSNRHLQPLTVIPHIWICDIEVNNVAPIGDVHLLSLSANPLNIVAKHITKAVHWNHGVSRIHHNGLLVREVYALPVQHNDNRRATIVVDKYAIIITIVLVS